MKASDLIFVFLGGGTGAICRVLCDLGISKIFPESRWPWGIFCINILGCLLIGLLTNWANQTSLAHSTFLHFAGAGILGGFTTFSTFSLQALNLAKNGFPGLSLLYALTSIALGILAAYIGLKLNISFLGK